MKIEKQLLDDHQMKLTVEVEPDSFETYKQRAARKLAQRVRIPGFRPGKAPYQVLLRTLGEGAIMEDALELLAEDIYPKVVQEAEIEPYGPGSLQNVVSMDPPILEFVVPLDSEVVLGDYRSIQKPYEPRQIGDEDVDRVIEDLRNRQAVLEPVERPAEVSDVVTVRLSGRRLQVEEGQEGTLVRERSFPIVIETDEELAAKADSEKESEWPFPGFSRILVGLSSGDEKTIPYTYPEDSEYETLRSVEAEFQLQVENIKSRSLPELNDEFATTVGDYADLESLRTNIRMELEQQNLQEYNNSYDEEVIDEVVALSTIKYPPQMVSRMVDETIHSLEHRLQNQGIDLDLYLKTRQMDLDALKEEAKPSAESRVKRELVLMELAKAEEIKLKPDEVNAETERTMDMLRQSLSEKEARRLGDAQVVSNLMSNIMVDMVTMRTIERLRKIASGQPIDVEEEVVVGNEVNDLIDITPPEMVGVSTSGSDEQPGEENLIPTGEDA